MGIISIILLSIGLSMDSFAVSVSNGLTIRNLTFRKALPIAFSFAFFQAFFPLIGWIVGKEVEKYIVDYDHWIAFLLLSFIGIKMIYESGYQTNKSEKKDLVVLTIVSQSIATSIDALIIGVGFALLSYPIFNPILIIGIVTFLFSMVGLRLGKYLGKRFEKFATIIGGIILILLGFEILIEHTLM